MVYLGLRKTSAGNKHAQYCKHRAGGVGGTIRAQTHKVNGFGRAALHCGESWPILLHNETAEPEQRLRREVVSWVEPLERELKAIFHFPVAAPRLQGRHRSPGRYFTLVGYTPACV